jgi:hypothetical protein
MRIIDLIPAESSVFLNVEKTLCLPRSSSWTYRIHAIAHFVSKENTGSKVDRQSDARLYPAARSSHMINIFLPEIAKDKESIVCPESFVAVRPDPRAVDG